MSVVRWREPSPVRNGSRAAFALPRPPALRENRVEFSPGLGDEQPVARQSLQPQLHFPPGLRVLDGGCPGVQLSEKRN